jgi:signal transduction histidine kinase
MLYLKQAAGDVGKRRRVPLAERTAIALEIALLAENETVRRSELAQALARYSDFAGWALRAAEHGSGHTINRIEEAADWLESNLAASVGAAIESDDAPVQPGDIQWRLPAVLAKLSGCERALADFESRLEREKIESLKELAYGASHEINNPLANIAARAQTLLDGEEDPERARKLVAIHRQAMRAHEMISDLMLFARPPKLVPRPLDLCGLMRRIVDEYRDAAEEQAVHLTCETDDKPIEALADETQIAVAAAALVRNALEAVLEGGQVRVTVRRSDSGANPQAEVTVCDNGPGISDEIRQHIFDPFFSGREAGRGLGFGLSKCWRIVTDHGGHVIVDRPATGGAEFRIVLPTVTETSMH